MEINKAINILERLYNPEPWDPRLTSDAYEALRMAIDALHTMVNTTSPTAPRITIRDIIDLLDYDRTGIRTVRIVDSGTKLSDTLQTDSYLMQYIEDMAVNCIDTVGGVITLYVNYGGEADE